MGDAKKILFANSARLVAWCAIAAPLLPRFGVAAVGAGLLEGFTVEGLLLARAVRLRCGLRCYRLTAAPSLAVLLPRALGFVTARSLDPSALGLVLVTAVTAGLLAVGLLVTARATLLKPVGLLRRLSAGAPAAAKGS